MVFLFLCMSFFRKGFRRISSSMTIEQDSFLLNMNKIELSMKSFDKVELKAWLYMHEGCDKFIIVNHGYRKKLSQINEIVSALYNLGYNVLLVFSRGHYISGGETVSLGVLEARDAALWVEKLASLYKDAKIALFGQNMGATVSVGALEYTNCSNLKCVVADTIYFTVADYLLNIIKIKYRKAPFKKYFLTCLNVYTKLFHHFSINYSLKNTLRSTKTPIMFIHGAMDSLVSVENAYTAYDICTAEKKISIYKRVEHSKCYSTDPDRYLLEFDEFVKKHLK